jgi:curli biogenesis system outer membrane secretion channel CsgG
MRVRSLATLALILIGGCTYGFRGGGGFPSSIRTVYVEYFENRTVQYDLENQIYDKLFDELPRRLGVRPAALENADAVVRGRITRYDDAARNYRPGEAGERTEILQRQVQITLAIEVVDTRRNVIIWESSGITGNGEYTSSTQADIAGQTKAIEDLVQQILDGVQSQW